MRGSEQFVGDFAMTIDKHEREIERTAVDCGLRTV
jgi:hypothetical protein